MDSVLSKVREFEARLDQYAVALPVFKYSKHDIIWHLLLVHEHEVTMEVVRAEEISDHTFAADWWKKALKHALTWAHRYGAEDPQTISFGAYSPDLFRMSQELLVLAGHYQLIFCAFSLLSNQKQYTCIDSCTDFELRLSTDPRTLQYEYLSARIERAKDTLRLKRYLSKQEVIGNVDEAMQAMLDSAEMLQNGMMRYPENVDLYRVLRREHEEESDDLLLLPDAWGIHGLPASCIRTVLAILRTLMFAHATIIGRQLASTGMIQPSILWVSNRGKLIRLICRIERSLTRKQVAEVLDFLVYDHSRKKADPATQPIVQFGARVVIGPRLIVNSNLARNLLVVLARDYPSDYDRVSEAFHAAFVNLLREALEKKRFHVRCNVRIPGRPELGDIDVLAYLEESGDLLLIEAKSVLAPGEPTEELSRAEMEEAAVVKRIIPRLEYVRANPGAVIGAIGLTATHPQRIHAVLAMRGFCGCPRDHEAEIPTIEGQLLLDMINSECSNTELVDWMMNRRFMPIEGKDYFITKEAVRFGPFTVVLDAAKTSELSGTDMSDAVFKS